MRTEGRIPAWVPGLLLFASLPFAGPAAVRADAGPGCGCAGMQGQGHGPGPGGSMAERLQGMRETLVKLRALEAKMEASKGTDDAAFRAASLEHAKLLGDLLEIHLKHMEGMRK